MIMVTVLLRKRIAQFRKRWRYFLGHRFFSLICLLCKNPMSCVIEQGPVDNRHLARIDTPVPFPLVLYLRELTAGTWPKTKLESEVYLTLATNSEC